MNQSLYSNLVLVIGVIQGLVFILFSFFQKKLRYKAQVYLSLLVLFLSLNNLEAWLNANNINFGNYYLDHLHTPWYILLAPFLYLFLSEYLRFPKKKLALYIPLSFFIGFSAIRFLYLYYSKELPIAVLEPRLNTFVQIAESIGFSITISIFIYTYNRFLSVKRKMLAHNIDDLVWINKFFKISLVVLIIWIIGLLSIIIFKKNIYLLLHTAVSFLIYWIAYVGSYKQRLFVERWSLRKKKLEVKTEIIDNLDSNEETKLFNSIEKHLDESEIYTHSTLSIEELASNVNIHPRKLSSIIKSHTNLNFSSFINKYRINKAKQYLQDKSYTNYSMESIGLESGFNSKTAFYTAFRNITGVSPKVWQMTHVNKK